VFRVLFRQARKIRHNNRGADKGVLMRRCFGEKEGGAEAL